MQTVNGLTKAILSFAFAALLAAPVSAASITGTFNLAGTAVGTTGGVTFYLTASGDNTALDVMPTTGSFTDITPGTPETIRPLTSANGVTPGTPFNFANWISLSDGIDLSATFIPIPSFPVCSATGTEAIGYECIVNAASPVVLTQNDNGVSARLNVDGQAYYAASPTSAVSYVALFTAPTTGYSTIAAFETYYDANNGIPPVSYSGSLTVTPEPETFALLGGGLLILVGACRRFKLRRNDS